MSQLFGMDFSSLVSRSEQASMKNEKVEHVKNIIGKPEVSKDAESYYEQLKAKYGDAEFVLVAAFGDSSDGHPRGPCLDC